MRRFQSTWAFLLALLLFLPVSASWAQVESMDGATVPSLPSTINATSAWATIASPHFGSTGKSMSRTLADGSTHTAILNTAVDFSAAAQTATTRFYIGATGTLPSSITLFARSSTNVANNGARDAISVIISPSGGYLLLALYDSGGTVQSLAGFYPSAGVTGATFAQGGWYTVTMPLPIAGTVQSSRAYKVDIKREADSNYLQHDGTWSTTQPTDGAAIWSSSQTVTYDGATASGYVGVQTVVASGQAPIYIDDIGTNAGNTSPPAGASYTIISGAVGGDNYKLLVPNGLLNATSRPLVVAFHGSGGDETQISTGVDWDTFRNSMIAAGYRVLCCYGAGETWASTAGQSAVAATTANVRLTYSTNKVLLYGVSQGGLNATIVAINALIPDVCGVGLNSPVLSLINAHDTGGFGTGIEAAYGGLSAYNAQKATHDPLSLALASSAATHALPFRFYVPTDDSTVPPAQHSTLFVPAIAAPEKTVISLTGNHVSPSSRDQTRMDDLVLFYQRCVAGTAQALTTIVVSPSSVSLTSGQSTQAFTASAKDAMGAAMLTQPTFTWAYVGPSINSSGVLSTPTGYTVTASASGVTSNTATVTLPVGGGGVTLSQLQNELDSRLTSGRLAKIDAIASASQIRDAILAAVVDGTITVKQALALDAFVAAGRAVAGVINPTTHQQTTTYYRADGTTPLATMVVTYQSDNKTITARAVTFSNLP